MENASKALIIAGAILISIVLIAVGVMVVNGANGAIDQAIGQMSEQEKTIFNRKFEPYEGTKKGTSTKNLISEVITSNARAEEDGVPGITVSIDGTEIANENLSTARSDIKNGTNYKIVLNYTSGVITSINITTVGKDSGQE